MQSDLKRVRLEKVIVDFGSRSKCFETFLKECVLSTGQIVFIDWDSYLWCNLDRNEYSYLQSSSKNFKSQ